MLLISTRTLGRSIRAYSFIIFINISSKVTTFVAAMFHFFMSSIGREGPLDLPALEAKEILMASS
jgi:hypothetical protein